ncbi:MAG: arylesterase [Methylophilaceae bacterium]|nr:arylesterase [Methylophilaceae bacterium]
MKLRFNFFRLFLTYSMVCVCNLMAINTVQAAAPGLLVFGDSLSAAYGIPREQGWVALLQLQLQKQGLPHQVVNASISGETTSGGASRIQAALAQYQPKIVLIQLGANDGLRGLPLNEMQQNLSTMIQASQRSGTQVVLIGMKIPPNYGPRYTRDFAAIYTDLAQKFHLPLVPFLLQDVAGNPALIQADGLHPVASAQEHILQTVWQVLQPIVQKKADSSMRKVQ